MKSRRTTLIIVPAMLGLLSIGAFAHWEHTKTQVGITFDNSGLTSIQYHGTNLLKSGSLRIVRVSMRDPSGATFPADMASTIHVDPTKHETTNSFTWGTVSTRYDTSGNRLLIAINTINKSLATIDQITYEPLVLAFPARVAEYDGSSPLLGDNVGNPTLVTLSYKDDVIVLTNEDVKRPLLIGFPWALDRPANTTFPLRIETGRDPMLPDVLPYINRGIPPGGSDVYQLSFRFGPRGTSPLVLGDDVLQRFAAAFPAQLHWKDRRPIGTVTLAAANLNSKMNPRGWFQDPKVDVTTEAGRVEFRQRMLQLAQSTVTILREMNAQGMLTWDIEGQEHNSALFVGDPRLYSTLAPEMTDTADQFFQIIRNAGFRVGVCVRPQELEVDSAQKAVHEQDTPTPGRILMDKISWAKQHWGASLFYIQFNGEPSRPMDADIIQRIAAAFPDVLLIPEHKNLRYYSFSAPYFSLSSGIASTPQPVKAVYPNAFSLINTADAQITNRRGDLSNAIKQGDVLMYRSWYDDPSNNDLKALYY